MRVLALEPFYGGSHRAFLDGWIAHSRHDWTVLGLPAYKWKWRMRHSAVTLADQASEQMAAGGRWKLLFCSDMLNLAEFLGLAPNGLREAPVVAYFHENQLTYPDSGRTERDYHFAFTNITTALAASSAWFNSAFHRDAFLEAAAGFLRRMPDHRLDGAIDKIREKTLVHYPGVESFPMRPRRKAGPLRILWSARWEADKNPETFFEALGILQARGVDFRLSVIGEQFSRCPTIFAEARHRFERRIDRWGYQESREEYVTTLLEADVVVSTARQEFFGIGIVEAMAAGAYPLLPARLAYPEVVGADRRWSERIFYSGRAGDLADRLAQLDRLFRESKQISQHLDEIRRLVSRFAWQDRGPALDAGLERILEET